MENIVHLALSNNNFNSTLPQSLGKLASVNFLSLAENQLVGEIPSEFDMLRNGKSNLAVYLQYIMLSSIGDGLEYFFKNIHGVYLYNPFACPLPTYISEATCSQCNSGTNHNSCEDCVSAGSVVLMAQTVLKVHTKVQ